MTAPPTEPPSEPPASANTPRWPHKDAICIDCRTALGSAEACIANAKHRVARLDNERDREALLSEVWGPPSRRRRAKQLAKAGAGGAAGGSLFEGCTDCAGCDVPADGEALIAVLIVVVAALAIIVIYYAIKKLVEYIRRRRNRLKPAGAIAHGVKIGRHHGPSGTVEAVHSVAAPLTGEPCVAYSVLFRHKKPFAGTDIMLRDAFAVDFDVRLDSGELVRVPAGPCAIDMHGAERIEPSYEALIAYVDSIDPTHTPRLDAADDYDDALPRDFIQQRVIAPGMRVEIRGSIRPTVDPRAPATGYRDSAATLLMPEGVPRLVVIS